MKQGMNVLIDSFLNDQTEGKEAVMIKAVFGCGLAGILALVGCQSGMYSSNVAVNKKDNGISDYTVVDSLDIKEYSQSMPVVVEYKSTNKKGEHGWNNLLWFLTLGIVPGIMSEETTFDVTVKTPIGEKTGTCKVEASSWTGWLPIFVPYPGIADERTSSPKLPNATLEGKARDQLVANLVSQFPKSEYVNFLIKYGDLVLINNQLADLHKHEGYAFADSVTKASVLNLEERLEEQIRAICKGCEGIIVTRDDAEKALKQIEASLNEVVVKRKAELKRKVDALVRCEEVKKRVVKLLDEKSFETAKQVVAEEKKLPDFDKENSEASMKALYELIADKEKEEADRKAREEKLKIEKQNREKELARIKEKKAQLEKLLVEKKYEEVIKLCDSEHEYSNPGFRSEDMLVWNDIKARAGSALVEMKKKAHAELAAKAESGDATAQYELGKAYAHGNEIVQKDVSQARKWLRKAYDNGVEKAWQEMERLME